MSSPLHLLMHNTDISLILYCTFLAASGKRPNETESKLGSMGYNHTLICHKYKVQLNNNIINLIGQKTTQNSKN